MFKERQLWIVGVLDLCLVEKRLLENLNLYSFTKFWDFIQGFDGVKHSNSGRKGLRNLDKEYLQNVWEVLVLQGLF